MVRRLIIASNRLPVSVREEHGVLSLSRSNGGLATALASLFSQDNSLWVGWTGFRRHMSKRELESLAIPPCFLPINLTTEEIAQYYDSFSNGILWPLAHGLPATAEFSEKLWEQVQRVTDQFAETIAATATASDVIWVHDYHLMLLPGALRRRGLKNRIGFFLHTPFPPLQSARSVPHLKEMAGSLLQADLIGLQVERDVRRFRALLRQLGLHAGSAIRSYPIGIDFDGFNSPDAKTRIERLAARYEKQAGGRTVIFSLSRLDYTKGIITQLRAYERLLADDPTQPVVYRLNIAPSRESMLEYRELREEAEAIVRSINTRFGTESWQPVLYSYENLGPEEMTAWYRTADIHLNTPVADGMNLIAKEYVAARKQPGVLVISRTMGAARQLHDALIVPPKSPLTICRALQQALAMPKNEKAERWHALRSEVKAHQVTGWADDFMKALG